jgi:hypothetical protein
MYYLHGSQKPINGVTSQYYEEDCHSHLILSSFSATKLIDAINGEKPHWVPVQIWYESKWFWYTKYYVKLCNNKSLPKLEFEIGPVLNRNCNDTER